LSEKRFPVFHEDILVSIYTTLTSQELVELYREDPYVYQSTEVVLKSASTFQGPSIEQAMASLFEYVKVAQYSPLIKAALVLYFTFAIAPFSLHNPLMGLLLFKAYLSHQDFEHVPLYLKIESLLTTQKETFVKVLQEVQKTFDITYLVNFLITILESPTQALLDGLTQQEGQQLKQERVQSRTREEQEIAVQMKAMKSELKTIKPTESLAHEAVTLGLEEHQAMQLEEHLLETNPSIKRLEAHFYARHCTIGKFYTIAQFKKKLSCAYETARTSMEHLTQLGYYRKEQYKNKFVYTPVNLEALLNNQVVIVILLLLFVSSIGLIAYFLQNKVPFFKQPEEKVDRETAVREEVERVIVKLDQRTFETVQPLKSDVKSKKKSPKPVAKKASSSKKKNAKSKS
jgi:hypothetical protein